MARAKARTFEIFGKIVIKKKNPWYHPRLLSALQSIGKAPKKDKYIFASPPPWFMNPQAMPPGVYERARLFSQVASETRGMPIEQRIKIIKERLSTGRKPRPSRAKPIGQRFHELYPTYEALRGVAPAPTAPTAPVTRF
jgi:hypothetical protein